MHLLNHCFVMPGYIFGSSKAYTINSSLEAHSTELHSKDYIPGLSVFSNPTTDLAIIIFAYMYENIHSEICD